MYTTKQKQTYPCRKQTSDYQQRKRKGEGQDRSTRLRNTNNYVGNQEIL